MGSVEGRENVLMRCRPSPFVESDEGEKAQKKIWDETIALLREEAKGVNVSLA